MGLGTDVAGGYHHSMLSAMRHAVTSAKVVEHSRQAVPDGDCREEKTRGKEEEEEYNKGTASAPKRMKQRHQFLNQFDYKDAFYLATTGGAEALGLSSEIGTFHAGKCFDALLVDMGGDEVAPVGVAGVAGSALNASANSGSSRDNCSQEHLDVFSLLKGHNCMGHRFEKWCNLGDDRNVAAVWVQNRLVAGTAPPTSIC